MSKSILVVDDTRSMRKMVTAVLQAAGYSVEAQADNARQTTDDVLRVLNGDPPTALVNRQVLPRARMTLSARV